MAEQARRQIEISMRTLVEFLLRHGDITPGSGGGLRPERAQLGSRIHRKLQKEFAEQQEGYHAEASVRYLWQTELADVLVTGRADGYWIRDTTLYLDEIKTVEEDLSRYEESEILHLAQAEGYAYLLALESGTKQAEISVIYYNIHTEERKRVTNRFSFSELEAFFLDLVQEYAKWVHLDQTRRRDLSEELRQASFPFPSYRAGQRELAVAVYRSIVSSYKLFVQAPTGIGKTMSVLFPALMAMREGCGSTIFYLTARTAGILAPQDSLERLAGQLPDLLSVTLTAQEKICPSSNQCDPLVCPRAKGHYDRINQALRESLEQERHFTREVIRQRAEQYQVCPHEFALDLSLWADILVCDYNYLFDPQIQLKRFFGADKKGDYVFLVDEAHNLPDRAREMYTARLEKQDFLQVTRWMKGLPQEPCKKIRTCANVLNQFCITQRKLLGDLSYQVEEEQNPVLPELLEPFCRAIEEYWGGTFRIPEEKELLEIYFKALFFCRISVMYDKGFCFCTERKGNDLVISLYCADPSGILASVFQKGRAAVLFSGTLQPLSFFFRALGGCRETDKLFAVPSPFPRENRLVAAVSNVATTYKKREQYYPEVAEYIKALAGLPKGNFMVFFSSYQFLRAVLAYLPEEWQDDILFMQPQSQDPVVREAFLEAFVSQPKKVHIGLCVLGGIYSEGIDLVGDRLSGVVVVGVGLPMVCLEREIIRGVFDRLDEGQGFDYAYVYPGINKVLQAAGRVIRTMEDRGFILLLDERYHMRGYRMLLPEDWNTRYCRSREEGLTLLRDFYEEENRTCLEKNNLLM